VAQATPEPAFDVASVKPSKSDNVAGMRWDAAQFRASNMSVRTLLRQAFGRWQDDEVVGGPAWLNTERWDIVAKADSPTAAMLPRLRTLLADRFKLVTHHETRELPMYALAVARSDRQLGPALRPSIERSTFRPGPGMIAARGVPISLLVPMLAAETQRTVVDRTELRGTYDVDLHWTPDNPSGGTNAVTGADSPSIFTAVREQLGLKLESTKGPVDVLVIDHVERPTED
jgi:uncharacterized protein (TIGR03435 family)